jgi:hypothetical protein
MSSYSFVFYDPFQVERLDLGRQIDSIALPNLWEAGCQDLCDLGLDHSGGNLF